MLMADTILIGPLTKAVTLAGLSLRGPLADQQVVGISQAGILIQNGIIADIGLFDELALKHQKEKPAIISPAHACVALPGLVDAHTHICFAGSRAADYAMRNAGKTYLEIAEAGGGIKDSVRHTRAASLEELAILTAFRAQRHLSEGVTTIEVKSGYGLSVEEELKMLSAIRDASELTLADLIPTCLAAHTLPPFFTGGAAEYLDTLTNELLPAIKREGLANRVDAFIEKSAFSAHDIQPYFTQAQKLGFDITVHADQFSTGGSEVAVRFGALSADHLEASTEREVAMIAASNTIATALPGASLGLGMAFTPARALLDAGACLAIASDWNPGSAPMGDLLMQAAILGAFEKLSHAEVWAGITYRSAAALGLHDRGRLQQGMQADIVFFDCADDREILYHQGKMKPIAVMKKGQFVSHPNLKSL